MVEMIVFVCRTLRQKCAHSTIAGCGRAQAEHNGKYKDNLTGGSPQKCMVTKDCYVGRALERLTVTTMMLCCDSTALNLAKDPLRRVFSLYPASGVMGQIGLIGLDSLSAPAADGVHPAPTVLRLSPAAKRHPSLPHRSTLTRALPSQSA